MTAAPLDLSAVRAEWEKLASINGTSGFVPALAQFAYGEVPALLDHIEMLQRVLRQIAFTEVHSPADFARTILEESVAS